MRSPRLPRRPRALLAVLALALLFAAPVTASQAPATAATEPTTPAEPPTVSAATLLERARADPRRRHATLLKLLTDFDGTPEAAVGALELVELLHQIWIRHDGGISSLQDALRQIEASKSYQRPEAVELRRLVPLRRAELAEWEAAVQHLERGKRGDFEGFQRCGEAYQAIHARLASDDGRAQATLYMAAQCLEAAGMWPEAAQAYERLLTLYSHGAYAQKTRESLVFGHLAVARFEDAARHAERYAALYPKEWVARDSLRIAFRARLGLGQIAQALKALDDLEAMYRKTDPERAAEIFWSRRDVLTDDDARLEHAKAYLERHGKRGGPDRLVVAHAVIGQLLWRRACEKGLMFDTCATLHRGRPQFSDAGGRNVLDRIAARRRPSPPPPPPTCREPSMPRGHLYPRAQKGAEEAQRYFATALQIARRQRIMIPEEAIERRREFTDAAAMAAVYVADRGFEELLSVLAQVSDAPDLKPIPELLARAAGLVGELEQQYAEIVAQKTSIDWSIAAAARLAQIAETRADALLRREVPRTATDKHLLKAHCATLREQAAPLYAAARAAYERCLERSIASGTFTDFSRLCEEALNHLDPARFPRTPEYTNRPARSPSRPDVVGVQLAAPQGAT